MIIINMAIYSCNLKFISYVCTYIYGSTNMYKSITILI